MDSLVGVSSTHVKPNQTSNLYAKKVVFTEKDTKQRVIFTIFGLTNHIIIILELMLTIKGTNTSFYCENSKDFFQMNSLASITIQINSHLNCVCVFSRF